MKSTKVDPYRTPESDVSGESATQENVDNSLLSDMNDEEIKKINKFSSDINLLGGTSVLIALVMASLIYDGFEQMSEIPLWPIVGFLLFSANAYACFARPAWGRAVGIISSLILMPGIPIGTILGYIGIKATTDGTMLYGKERIRSTELGEAIARIEQQSA